MLRAATQRSFWMALARALLGAPVLAALAIPAALLALAFSGMGPWRNAAPAVVVLAAVLGATTLLRAWSPLLAKEAARILGLRLNTLPLPSFWRFLAWCAMTTAFLAIVNKVPVVLPDWTLWLVGPIAALVVSAFLVRSMLCVHADTERYRAVLRGTIIRRTLLWIPVSVAPFLLCAYAARLVRGMAWWRNGGFTLGWVLLLILAALVLMLWAALSLQAMQSVPGRQEAPALAEPAPASSARPWLLAMVALGLFGIAVAAMNSMAVTHHYLRLTDARYQPARNANLAAFQHLSRALVGSACKGDLGFLKKLMEMKVRPSQETLSEALDCAVRRSQAATATYLLDHEASTFAALRSAVAERNLPMVRLLVARGAAADRYESYSAELGMAARSGDLVLAKILIDGGAVQDGYSDAGKIPLYEYLVAAAPADDAAGSWASVVADAEAAGFAFKSKYKKADGPLHFAASKGYLGLVEVLLARGMDHKLPAKGGVLPFQTLAAWYSSTGAEPGPGFERVMLALARDVEINAPPASTHKRVQAVFDAIAGSTSK